VRIMDLRTAPPSLSLPVVFGALLRAVGNWAGRGRLESVMAVLLYGRVAAMGRRLERMLARFAAGHRMRREKRCWRPSAHAQTQSDSASVAPTPRLWPRRFGWLCAIGTHEAAGIGGQLGVVLAHPDMAALLAAAPQARRLLSPLCRALGVEAALLGPVGRRDAAEHGAQPGFGKVVRRAVAPSSGTPVSGTPVERLRMALPRGVLAAARRQGFAKRK